MIIAKWKYRKLTPDNKISPTSQLCIEISNYTVSLRLIILNDLYKYCQTTSFDCPKHVFMSKRKRTSRIEKWIKEGSGSGNGTDYKPWLKIQEVSL